MSDASSKQYPMQSSSPVTSLSRLVNHGLTRELPQFIDNIMTPLTPHQQSSHRTSITNAHCVVPIGIADLSQLFGCWQVGEIGSMSFASMNYCHSKGPRHLEDFLDCGNNRSNRRVDLVIATLNGAKAVLVDKVPLHVDYEQCCCSRREVVSIRASI